MQFFLYNNHIALKRLQLLPVPSAECERRFSCMNINDTPVRSRIRIAVNTLASLIFVKVNGPPSVQFKRQSCGKMAGRQAFLIRFANWKAHWGFQLHAYVSVEDFAL